MVAPDRMHVVMVADAEALAPGLERAGYVVRRIEPAELG